MVKNFPYKLLYLILGLLIWGCASPKVQYSKKVTSSNTENKEYNSKIDHAFYLIGDAGNAKMNEDLSHFKLLKNEISTSEKNTTVLFLGDNLYENGMPESSSPDRNEAEHKLNAQIDLVKDFKGQTIFIPGNHDYYNNGVIGLQREADYITEKLKNENTFLPKNGCPITSVNISNDIILIVIDSQWYIENWNDNPTMNNDCEIKTRDKFFQEYERLIKNNALKTTIVAIHHPMYSYGFHGGQYTMKDQLYPTGGTIPLPIFGSLFNVIQKTSGFSSQDMISSFYKELRKRLLQISEKYEPVIFVSGHEHNLQYIVNGKITQIISGSGSKTSAARVMENSQFSYGGLGYAKFVKYTDGASWVYFYTEKNGKKELLYKAEVEPKNLVEDTSLYEQHIPEKVTASVYTKKQVDKSGVYVTFWGKHYRKYYGTEINASALNLDTIFGGLTPYSKEGSRRSQSLFLKNEKGQEFTIRPIHKSAIQLLQEVTFKDTSIEDGFNDTYAESLLLDLYTTAHPFSTFTIGKLSDAANIYHTNPKLYYIPKQPALKEFNAEFGGELYLFEKRASSGHGDTESFGYSNTIISTDVLAKNLREYKNHFVDEDSYIRTRLFDMLVGDWNRSEEKWRWAEFKEGDKTIYKPVSHDRDQAFSKYDGPILGILTRIVAKLKRLQVYDKNINNLKWFNEQAHILDMALINQSTYKNWKEQVAFLQENITNEVIDSALAQMPIEVQDETIIEIKDQLKGRLNNLQKIAKKYYKSLIKYPVVKGNDFDNWFEITHLKHGETSIKIYNIENGEKGDLFFERIYTKKETAEIWVYGLDGKDVFNVTGQKNQIITLRLAGGQKNDIYNVETGKKVTIYDFKTNPNTFETKEGKKRLVDDYNMNLFDYHKLKYTQNQLIPIIGSNPDDGLKVGAADILSIYGFERNPFTQKHSFEVGYYFLNNSFDLRYDAEFAYIFNDWNFLLETYFTSPKSTRNFYGYGNDTKNYDDEFGDDYHRIPLSTRILNPSLKWRGRMGSEFKIGPTFESYQIEETINPFINPDEVIASPRKNYVGFVSSFSYENFNKTIFPTLGMATSVEVGWKTNVNTNSKENNGFITPSVAFNYNITSNGKLMLATKLKANVIIGNTFQFYNAASVGGLDGLRGYNNHRFTGNTSYYQNTDIRYNLTNLKTDVIPIQIGLFGGFDYGRVWYRGKESNDWKTSYGGGLWIDTAQLVNFSISAFNATEGVYFRFGLGFGF